MYFADLTLQSGRFDGAVINGDAYMVITHLMMTWLVPSKCPHRGGPLHLGREMIDKILCPWHGQPTEKVILMKKALPYLRVGNKVTITCVKSVESLFPLHKIQRYMVTQ